MRGASFGLRTLARRLLQPVSHGQFRPAAASPSLVVNNDPLIASSLYSRVADASTSRALRSSLEVFRPVRWLWTFHAESEPDSELEDEKITVTFVTNDGEETDIHVPVGMSMLEAACENDIELEGACEGEMACATCHVIISDEELFKKLPEPCDQEMDMLDMARDVTETSRLGCQLIATPELDGIRLALPAATEIMR